MKCEVEKKFRYGRIRRRIKGKVKIASNFKDMKSPSPHNPIPNNPTPDNKKQPIWMANYHLNNETDRKIVLGKLIRWKMTRT